MLREKNEKKLKKQRNKKKFRIILISMVIFYLIFRIIPTLQASKLNTYTVVKEELEKVEKLDGIVFRDEKIYKAKTTGKVTYIKKEGLRVGVGEKIAEISLNNDTEEMKEELKEIEKKIENLKENNISKSIFKDDIEKNQNYINSLIKEIQENILQKNYKKASELREMLEERLDKQKTFTGQTGYNANNIERLEERKIEILNMIKGSNIANYTDTAGIVSYNIDNLEMIYLPNKLTEFYPENYKVIDQKIIKQNSESSIKTGEPIYKIVDNYQWYIATKLQDKEIIESLNNRRYIYVRLNDSKEALKARIMRLNTSDDEAVAVLMLNKKLYDYYQERYVKLELILNRYEGLKIPSKSIVDNNGIKGVYIKGAGGIIKFRGIKILGQNEEYIIVEEGKGISKSLIEININGKNKDITTLSIYDEIIVNGNKVKEGEIIN